MSTTKSDGIRPLVPTGRRVAALVRHGHFDRPDETASAHQLLPLSAAGRKQARDAVAAILRHCDTLGLELDSRIESSQLLRAWETARLMAEELETRTGKRFEVVERTDLAERGTGSCANLRFDRIKEILAQDPRLEPLPEGWRRLPEYRLPVLGAESLMDAGGRVAGRIQDSLREIPAEDSRDLLRLFVAHGGCLRHACVHLGTLDLAEVESRTMDHAQCVLIELGEDGWFNVAGEWKKRLLTTEPTD